MYDNLRQPKMGKINYLKTNFNIENINIKQGGKKLTLLRASIVNPE